jgi:hypothetical protein
MMMKHIYAAICPMAFASAATVSAADYTLNRTVDYRRVLGPHDLVVEQAPSSYANCAFLGNGMMGSTIWARPGETMHWCLGRNDVCNTRERHGSHLLIGNLALVPPHVSSRNRCVCRDRTP